MRILDVREGLLKKALLVASIWTGIALVNLRLFKVVNYQLPCVTEHEHGTCMSMSIAATVFEYLIAVRQLYYRTASLKR